MPSEFYYYICKGPPAIALSLFARGFFYYSRRRSFDSFSRRFMGAPAAEILRLSRLKYAVVLPQHLLALRPLPHLQSAFLPSFCAFSPVNPFSGLITFTFRSFMACTLRLSYSKREAYPGSLVVLILGLNIRLGLNGLVCVFNNRNSLQETVIPGLLCKLLELQNP